MVSGTHVPYYDAVCGGKTMRLVPESEMNLGGVVKLILGGDGGGVPSLVKVAAEERTFRQIHEEEDPGGKGHDLFLKCTRCDASETCRCSKPKREFRGICDKCASGNSDSAEPINQTASVFVLEDDQNRIDIFNSAYGKKNVVTTKSVKEAIEHLRSTKFAKVFLDRDLSSNTETGEDVAWQMEKENLCRTTPVEIHSETARGQKVMARYLSRYHGNVTVMPFRELRKHLEIPGGIRI